MCIEHTWYLAAMFVVQVFFVVRKSHLSGWLGVFGPKIWAGDGDL